MSKRNRNLSSDLTRRGEVITAAERQRKAEEGKAASASRPPIEPKPGQKPKPVKLPIQNPGPRIQALKDKGYGVRVNHKRFFPTVIFESGAMDGLFLTRQEFEDSNALKLAIQQAQPLSMRKLAMLSQETYQQVVSPEGGVTVVTVITDSGKIRAEAICSFKDKYSRKQGLNKALDRLGDV